MRNKIAKALLQNGFWLSLLMHLLFLASFSMAFIAVPLPQEKSSPYIPSYTYDEYNSRASSGYASLNKKPTSQNALQKQSLAKVNQSVIPDTRATIDSEAVHFIGNKKLDKPLLKIIGKALTAYIIYPKIAADFHTKGTVVIGFTLYPDGHLTDVQLVRTSGADILDQAVLVAANKMSPLKNVNTYLDKPKYFEFGVIF